MYGSGFFRGQSLWTSRLRMDLRLIPRAVRLIPRAVRLIPRAVRLIPRAVRLIPRVVFALIADCFMTFSEPNT